MIGVLGYLAVHNTAVTQEVAKALNRSSGATYGALERAVYEKLAVKVKIPTGAGKQRYSYTITYAGREYLLEAKPVVKTSTLESISTVTERIPNSVFELARFT